jgi:uncharacterized DUF497 family protein
MDEEKRAANLKRHGFDFADVAQFFENPRDTIIDDRFDYGEIRFFTIGLVNGRVVAISHTETEDVIRIISARKADRNEQTKYFKEIADRLGEN